MKRKKKNEKERTKSEKKEKALLGIEHLPLHRAKYFFFGKKNTMGRFLQTITPYPRYPDSVNNQRHRGRCKLAPRPYTTYTLRQLINCQT